MNVSNTPLPQMNMRLVQCRQKFRLRSARDQHRFTNAANQSQVERYGISWKQALYLKGRRREKLLQNRRETKSERNKWGKRGKATKRQSDQ